MISILSISVCLFQTQYIISYLYIHIFFNFLEIYTFKELFTFAGILYLLRSVFFNLHYLFIL